MEIVNYDLIKKGLEKMIINDNLKLNEVKSFNLGNGSTAYRVGNKFYLKKGDVKKEISPEQFSGLINKTSDTKNDKDLKIGTPNIKNTIKSKFRDFSGQMKKSVDYMLDKGETTSKAINSVFSNFEYDRLSNPYKDASFREIDNEDEDEFAMSFNKKGITKVKSELEKLAKDNDKVTFKEGRRYNSYIIRSDNGTGDTEILVEPETYDDDHNSVYIYSRY